MAKKIKECPNCNSPRIAKILYGMPMFDDKLDKEIKEGRIALGGCCISDNSPDYVCGECGASINSKTGKFTLNEEDGI